jgi:hypothetical protein
MIGAYPARAKYEWELMGKPSKSVGPQDYVAPVRRVDRPADIREGRWGVRAGQGAAGVSRLCARRRRK